MSFKHICYHLRRNHKSRANNGAERLEHYKMAERYHEELYYRRTIHGGGNEDCVCTWYWLDQLVFALGTSNWKRMPSNVWNNVMNLNETDSKKYKPEMKLNLDLRKWSNEIVIRNCIGVSLYTYLELNCIITFQQCCVHFVLCSKLEAFYVLINPHSSSITVCPKHFCEKKSYKNARLMSRPHPWSQSVDQYRHLRLTKKRSNLPNYNLYIIMFNILQIKYFP